MRIALASDGTRGDLYPLLALGEALRARGADAVVCGPPNFREVVEARGLAFRCVGLDVRRFLTEQAHALTGSGPRLVWAMARYQDASVRAQFAQLPEATAGADLVVAAGVQVAAASAAELHGIPYRYVVYCPALLRSDQHTPVFVRSQDWPRWAVRMAWWATLGFYERMLRRPLARERAALGLPAVGSVYRHLLGERPLLAADRELAPAPDDGPVPVEQTRCLHPHDGEPLPPKLESFLDGGPAPVYFGFGSMTDPDPARTTRELLRAVERVGCRALVSAGWAGLGDGPLPDGVMAIGPVTHARLFPRVAAVVHHGGAGTTTTAARAGAPQLVVPHVLDQFYWAARVQRLGVAAPPIARRRLTAARLADALAALLDNELLAERARELGERLRRGAAAEPDVALSLIAA